MAATKQSTVAGTTPISGATYVIQTTDGPAKMKPGAAVQENASAGPDTTGGTLPMMGV
jgi:hypothetical protein